MAVKLGGKANWARGYAGRRKFSPVAEINVTPMVDVMLVLLIIFMVTAPLLTVGVEVDLPQTKAEAMDKPEEPLVVTVKKDGAIFILESPVTLDQLGPRLKAITAAKPDTVIYVRGDRAADYGSFASVLAELQAAGLTKIGLVTDALDKPAAKPANGN